MKYFSLFSGCAVGELAIHNVYGSKAECVGYSEIDKYASSVYKKHFPEHENLGDATRINTGGIDRFNLLIAGFPCQSFSIAGKRKGFQDARGTLFFEICRIARDIRPEYLLLENVKGLLSHDNGETFRTILASLDDIGYDTRWCVYNSKDFGVPQNRERVFIAGSLRGKRVFEIFPVGEGFEGGNERVQPTSVNSITAGGHSGGHHSQMTLIELTKDKSQGYRVYDPNGLSASIASQAGDVGAKTGLYAVEMLVRPRNLKTGEFKTKKLPCLRVADGGYSRNEFIKTPRLIRRLTPTECERLQGLPDGWTKYGFGNVKISDTQRYKMLGNAFTRNVAKWLIEQLPANNQ